MQTAHGEVVVRTVDFTKVFNGVPVLQNASVELKAGEIHAFMGENGAGKSTLAKLIAGVYSPTSGTMELGGKAVSLHSPRAAAAHGIAIIPQEPLTFPDLSAAENIFAGRLPLRKGQVDWKGMYQKAGELLQTLGVSIDPAAPARGLSVADRQMLELAGALFQKVRVLLLDETTASLTPHEVARLGNILRRLQSEGVALAFISHRMEEIFDFCDRITVLRDGEIVGTRKTHSTNREELLRLMVGRDVELLQVREKTPIGKPVLQVRGLSRARKFDDISFTVHAGEVVGLAGLVGAGRTEVARCLFGLLPAESGEIILDNVPIAVKAPGEAMRLGIALVPEDRQRHGALLPLSLTDNATLCVLPRLSPGGWLRGGLAKNITDNWITRLHVRCKNAAQSIGQLSGGNQQKIVLAKWLETKPRLLILDEPTRGIDVRAKSEVHRVIAGLAKEGLAVLLISSDLPEVLTMSDRVLVMREGRLVREFAPQEATSEAIIAAASGATNPNAVSAAKRAEAV